MGNVESLNGGFSSYEGPGLTRISGLAGGGGCRNSSKGISLVSGNQSAF